MVLKGEVSVTRFCISRIFLKLVTNVKIIIFGIKAVSLDVAKIVKVFVFHAVLSAFDPDFKTHAFGHRVNFTGRNGH